MSVWKNYNRRVALAGAEPHHHGFVCVCVYDHLLTLCKILSPDRDIIITNIFNRAVLGQATFKFRRIDLFSSSLGFVGYHTVVNCALALGARGGRGD